MSMAGTVLTGSTGITPRLQLAQYCTSCKNCLASDFFTWGNTDDRQTDTFVKSLFFTQGVSERKDLMRIPKVIFHIKPILSN